MLKSLATPSTSPFFPENKPIAGPSRVERALMQSVKRTAFAPLAAPRIPIADARLNRTLRRDDRPVLASRLALGLYLAHRERQGAELGEQLRANLGERL